MRQSSARILIALVVLSLLFGATTAVSLAQEQNLVRSIVVQGNNMIDTETIKATILKTEINQPAVEQRLLDDLYSIYDLGYFQDAFVSLEPALGGVQVIFNVVENPIVQEVGFSGLTKIPFADYAKQMKTQPGYILNIHDLGDDLDGLHEWIAVEYGYLARIVDVQADDDGRVEIDLVETRIKDVVIAGNEKTKDFVIERELTFKPGDPVNLKEIDQSLRNVLMLGFFDEIGREFSDEEDPDETILTIDLKEQKTGAATFGVGYSPGAGFSGFIEAADQNFLGRGQKVNATLDLGKEWSFELGFQEPYITKTGTSLGVSVYRKGERLEDDKTKSKGRVVTNGGNLTLGHPFAEFTRGRLSLTLENNKHEVTEYPGIPEWKDYDYNNRTIGFGVNTNTLDHPFSPTKGYRSDAYLEFAGKILGGTTQYAKLRLEYSRFFEVKDGGYVLAVRGLGGRLLAGDFSPREKFKIGGADTLRGYTYGDDKLSLTGDHMLVFNAEFRFPIVEKVTGVVFSDWGTTWEFGSSFKPSDLNNGFGLGVRLDTPLGLLRLDYGLGKDEFNNRKGQFYFGIGQAF